MGKIPAATAAAMFEEIIGWPYVSPGTNDQRGIDCSGAWVRAYKAHGKTIDHGSNSQFRRFCREKGEIAAASQLRVGMAVFKCKPWDDSQKNHRDYGSAPGNLYHVGCVTSVNPLRIVHATPDFAKVDTTLGKWAYWGWLKEVEPDTGTEDSEGYDAWIQTAPVAPLSAEPGQGQAKVVTNDKKGLNLRREPNPKAKGIKTMPDNTVVDVLDMRNGWAQVWYVAKDGTPHKGWCSADYLRFG